MRHLSLILTTFCDWSCSYCNATEHGTDWITKEKVDAHIPYLKSMLAGSEIILSGGEIGYVDKDVLIYLLEQLDRRVVINTNGIFMEAGLHKEPSIRKYIKKILYHVVAEPRNIKMDVYEDVELDVSYGLVGNDADAMKDFIEANEHITFDYVSIATPFQDVDVDYVKLMLRVKDLPNVSQGAIELLEVHTLKHNHVNRYRKSCRATNFAIDLASEEICLCAFRNKHINIELSKDNMISVLTGENKFEGDDNCHLCHRVCLDTNIQTITKDIIRNQEKYGKA